MSLSDLAALASVISGLAVLASLVFLYFQLRQLGAQVAQAEANQRAMINEAYVTRVTDFLKWQAEPQTARLLARADEGETRFTAAEVTQLHLLFRAGVLSAQAVSQHRDARLIDQVSYDAAMLAFRFRWLEKPIYRAMWKRQSRLTSPAFRAVVEQILRETPVLAPIDVVARFQQDLAEVSAEEAARPTA